MTWREWRERIIGWVVCAVLAVLAVLFVLRAMDVSAEYEDNIHTPPDSCHMEEHGCLGDIPGA